MLKEEDIRKKIKLLRKFYMDVVNFIVVNILLILIWLTFDKTGSFWPKYVMVTWGIVLFFKAYRMGIIPFMFPKIAFLSHNWEEKKVREILRHRVSHRKTTIEKHEKEK